MSTLREAIEELNKKPCACVPCDFCDGNGTYRIDLHGKPTKAIDDLYELEYCDECRGGIVEDCERCIELRELEQQLEEQENRA